MVSVIRQSVTLILLSFMATSGFARHDTPLSSDAEQQKKPLPKEDTFFSLPATPLLNPDKVELGKQLFADKRLSYTGQQACIDCHQLRQGGDSGRDQDPAHSLPDMFVNTPSIFNVEYNFRQNWDGSQVSLVQENRLILQQHQPAEQALPAIIERLHQDSTLSANFSRVYREGLTEQTLVDSLVEYERSLTTPDSRFDRFLNGDRNALSKEEFRGYQLFKSLGCTSCHQGINIGGNLYQKFGVFYNYIAERGNLSKADLGRFNHSGREMDRFVFKVPSLRNVAVTAPYLHDGSAATLEEAIAIVGKTQLGRDLDAEQIRLLKAFLQSLTGRYENQLLTDHADLNVGTADELLTKTRQDEHHD